MKTWWTTTGQLEASAKDGYPPRLYTKKTMDGKTFHEGNLPVEMVVLPVEEFRKEKWRAFEMGFACADRGSDRYATLEDYEKAEAERLKKGEG